MPDHSDVQSNLTVTNGGGGIPQRCFGHTLPERPQEDWQDLRDHLEAVAGLAEEFAGVFGAAEWGRLAGLWHDVGKYSHAFQSYLRAANDQGDLHQAELTHRVDHSTAGAKHAVDRFPVIGHLLAYCIAGHHSGLHDAIGPGACLENRLGKDIEPWKEATPAWILEQPAPELPDFIANALGERDGFVTAFFGRMVFSALVDADFLDTEAFMAPELAAHRPRWSDDILERLDTALDTYVADLERNASSTVDPYRSEVRAACLRAAEDSPGLFSLTVPTGGGKTLSSLGFALKHAKAHGFRRVVYVVPFTSIIEQNANEFRKVAGPVIGAGIPDPVVEHHSNLDPQIESTTNRLASENWDAPIIVTTAVQFYESLFANRTSRCRKLHNLANSVIILDEAQALPVDFLQPCLAVLHEIVENYGTSVVLCTATQPAIEKSGEFPIGLDSSESHEIIPDPPRLFAALKRVSVENTGSLPDEELVDQLLEHDQVLCIVNTRGHARRIAELIQDAANCHHLSALMCPEHRSAKLDEIRARLDDGQPCKVVSTRLVEAGVDIDFPVVYRSMAGLDSIAQAAGRCNRNGTLEQGRTIIFESEHRFAERFLADTANCARQVLEIYESPLELESIEHYFRLYYWDQSDRWDHKQILQKFKLGKKKALPFLFSYMTAAQEFRLIDDPGQPIIIPWGEDGARACEELRFAAPGPSVQLRRRLQRYTVQVSPHMWTDHVHRACEILHDAYAVLTSPDLHYSDYTGLKVEDQLLIC